jgi:hypothetical protein
MKWRNAGQTPALEIRTEAGFEYVPATIEKPASPVIGTSGDSTTVATQGVDFSNFTLALPDAEWLAFKARQIHILIRARVSYFDVFADMQDDANRRVSEITLRLIHQGGTERREGEMVESIMFLQYGPDNRVT